MTKGTISFWGHDITKMTKTLGDLSKSVKRVKMNPLLKQDILKDINTVIRLIYDKGKMHK